jgi:hypothetical protein
MLRYLSLALCFVLGSAALVATKVTLGIGGSYVSFL